jgi:fructokinase
MVTLGPSGARSFDFFRGAHEKITPRDVSLPNETFLLHFGSIMQIGETGAQATQKLISQAKKHGTILSYDPNIREKLWENLNRARDVILATAKEVDILKISEEEAHILSPDTTFEEAAQQLCTDNLEILIITRGREGCYFMTKKFNGYLPTISVDAVDTTGAGDAFNAGFIYQLLRTKKRVSELTRKELEQKLRFAEVVGSLTTTKKGALTAFPTIHEIYMYTDFIQNIQPT